MSRNCNLYNRSSTLNLPAGKLSTPTPTIPFTKLKMALDIEDLDPASPPAGILTVLSADLEIKGLIFCGTTPPPLGKVATVEGIEGEKVDLASQDEE